MVSSRSILDRFECLIKYFLPLFALVLYSFFGAFLFHLIEEPHELDQRETRIRELENLRISTARNLSEIFGVSNPSKFNNSVLELRNFQRHLGVNYDSALGSSPKWSFWGSLFYSLTLYTTIGYGYQAPQTVAGKVVTCLYSMFGIPLALYALVELGFVLAYGCRALWSALLFCTKLCQCKRKRKWSRVNRSPSGGKKNPSPASTADADLLSLPSSILILVTVCWFFGSAGIFLLWQPDWTYWLSLYFTFISFTTIGLGDVTPTNYDLVVFSCMLIILSLALVSSCIALLQMKLEALFCGMEGSVDDFYKTSVVDASEGEQRMTKKPYQVDLYLQRMARDLAPGGQFLYRYLLPHSKKQKLFERWMERAQRNSRSTQTEPLIMPPSTFRHKGLGVIGEEGSKSHDDINSLVMMCDFGLRI